MRLPSLLLIWFSVAATLPLAPPPPDFIADFSKRAVKSDLMAVVDEDELQSLRHNGFQEQLRNLREKNIGRDSMTMTEEMAKSVEDISEFSLDSNEVDEALNDITVPTNSKLEKSSKFSELAQIHNTDSSNTALPPFAFSEDEESDPNVERVEVQKVAVTPPKIVPLVTKTTTTTTVAPTTTTTMSTTVTTTTTPATTTSTTTQPTTTSTTTLPSSTVNIIDSDVEIPKRAVIPIEITTTTLSPIFTTTRFSYSPTTRIYTQQRTQSPHIFSSSTVRLPSAIPLTSGAPRAFPIVMTTPRPSRGAIFETEFTIEPKRSEGGGNLRDRIRSTSQLLNLLGDRIEGIDQQQMGGGTAPKTGVLTNIYDQGVVKRRNYRNKQWGRTSGNSRQGVQTYDGQFTGMAYGATKQKGGGYTMRKKMAKRPWTGRGYKTRKLGERRPDTMRPATFVEKRTTEVSVEPYGSKRRGEWIRGVKLSERRNAVRRVSETQKSLAEALMESEEASMRQLKNTLRQIRDVVKFKTSSTTAKIATSTQHPVKIQHLNDSFFKGQFDFRH